MRQRDASLPLRLLLTCLPLGGLLIAVLVAGLIVGSSSLALDQVLPVLLGRETCDPTILAIVWKLRLPRTLLAALAGGALSLSGLVFQTLVRNPLADPYILGVSGGAGLGAVGGVLLGLPFLLGAGPLAFAGAMAAFTLTVVLSLREGRVSVTSLVLSGVMVNAFCSAAIMFFLSVARDHTLHATLVWLMGDTSSATLNSLTVLAPCVVAGTGVVFVLSQPMNLLLLGDEAAANLGVRVRQVRALLVVAAALMTSTVVSQTGLLGFVGLVCPHILRLICGHDQRVLVPGSLLFGACFLVSCDLLARLLSHEGAMPVGVLTAMLGAPIFLYLLRRSGA
ncbi:transport system permease protein [Solidesulfovibrio fructosivorans JJ]]|uniref:Transport system permease protein n=1 Tax=Solidesulfovibrio fructosivorans JJ] TaxID=596151 RepID=E1JWW9_SOLFR|nr:iron ABC transporter permease [Solidesulfovibrio fructosivorans]EFL51173.1 transport system permease protein [Solidesulfovibrio fructosivorans JJ]]